MSKKKIVSGHKTVGLEIISPETASQWLEAYAYAGQRSLSQEHVNFLGREMQAGRFTTNTIVLAEMNGQRFLVNGQHTLWAIFESGVTLDLPVEHYSCRTADDLALLYTTLDVGKVRSPAQGFKPYNLSETLGLTVPQLRSLYAAVKLIGNDFTSYNRRPGIWALKDEMAAWTPDMKKFLSDVEKTPLGPRMLRRDVVSVGIVTYRYTLDQQGPEYLRTFWNQVASDDGLRLGDPRKSLNRFLSQSVMKGSHTVMGLSLPYALRAIAHSWNCHWEGRDLSVIRVDPASRLAIRGTPYG